jgi:hypothetical protein
MSAVAKHNEVQSFETNRRALTGLAYRMLGSRRSRGCDAGRLLG